MIFKGVNDGDYADINYLCTHEFYFNKNRDFTSEIKKDSSNTYEYKYNFVGFLTNKNNDIITVFPKKYKAKDIEADSKKIFRAIFKHKQLRPSFYIGPENEEHLKTNYPFAAFYEVYEYYLKYGIHFEEETYLKAYGTGKVNWKETIRLSNKLISNKKLIMMPVFHNQTIRSNTFITDCMVFIINYTLDKFHYFIDASKVNYTTKEFEFISNTDHILETLHGILIETYNDKNINLITNIIDFFSNLNIGGSYYLKHYSFYAIWEEMVLDYLNKYYLSYNHEGIVFSPTRVNNCFYSPTFYPNIANYNNSFQPDFYLVEDNTQLIFDAKYYDVVGMDYKQIAYLFFLKNKRDEINQDYPTYTKTHAALLIPSEGRSTRKHFAMNPLYNREYSDFYISEERLNIYKIIDSWIEI